MKNDKIKILHFPIRNSNGGVTRSAMKLWKYIDHNRFQFGFATCSKKLDFEKDILDQGCKLHYISCYAEENAEKFCKELKEILMGGYDAIHLNTSWWKSFYAEQVANEVGIKTIIVHARSTFVDLTDSSQREKELLEHEKCKEAFTSNLATHFLTCSTEAADFIFNEQIPRERIWLFHNALDIERYSYDEQKRIDIRHRLGLDGKFVVGSIGRMAYAKNQFFLVDCFDEIQKKAENAILLLVGDGELKDELHKHIEEHRISDKVIFVGAVDNPEDYLQVMDVFVLPSRFEGLPNVLIEAQAAGLKCISSNLVTKEAKVTDNVVFVELEKEKWIDAILKYSQGYERKKTDAQMRSAGYDIRQEIQVLEKIYAGEA